MPSRNDRSRSPPRGSGKDCFLFVGNPGTGKSTLLNGVIGEPLFKSGASTTGAGVTSVFDSKEIQGKLYMDTPGLSDVMRRQEAAAAITEALKQNGFYRIFFVLTVEAGRVRPDDKTTMELILNAAPTITSYSVIINKVSNRWLADMQDPDTLRAWQTKLMEGLPKVTTSIHLMTLNMDLLDCPDVKYNAPDDVIFFIKNAPGMMIMSQDVNDVKEDQFEAMKEEHAKLITRLEDDKEELKQAAARQEAQFKEAMEAQTRAMDVALERADKQIQVLGNQVGQAQQEAARAKRDAERARDQSRRSGGLFGGILIPGIL